MPRGRVKGVFPLSQTGGPGLCRRAPGAPLTESEREEGPVSRRYTGGVKRSPLSTPEIFRFFQRLRFDLAAIDKGNGEDGVVGGRENNKNKRKSSTPESEQIDIS